ncbi:bifunctional 4-hydroxy-3-methylbut-2-enyl diphosphate reductase/30S ribosomal protein S1 [Garciella nitratireducens]|uniref:bifunctional 4-hydroxy-3-methylbut-2-enyl diphosphate reductase/30S ribosomal protein S1 n=1 Tax=Garciella nitratireducens TaxID=218205 RepID=UPI000DE95148|nr:bifunctional 4-hydroxy-3-methylbut-2-enyl diphosphate reductase/30S ribosomal protein S1 [Garciella nitratireducens]RBP45600.1 4-hydroxy-3-methylbut-2-enyl diphosphate reductase [Garciella nitratireducens]
MKIFVAKNAGYCFGVQKAIETAEKSINQYPKPIYTLGPIIHNNQVIKGLENQGVYAIDKVNKVQQGTIIIRSHGVEPKIYEQIKKRGLKIIDATCPYVKNIQNKVQKYYQKGYQIIIVGNKRHPEVIGVNGWCDNTAIILDSIKEAENISNYQRVCIVSQTTIIEKHFSEIVSKIIPKSREIIIFNTICNTTTKRQEEAKKLSKVVDAMIIIGGYHSSNTQKLVSICKKYCKNTYHIETYKDLSIAEIKTYNKIGITAGASTPDWIIKEVIEKMQNKLSENNEKQIDFEDSFENTIISIKENDIVSGEVVSVNENEVIVNIGYKSDAIIPKDEFTDDISLSLKDLIQTGDVIEAIVLKINDGEGNVILSKKRLDKKKAIKKIEYAYKNKEILNGKIIKIVKGGFIVDLGFKQVFMPLSQYHVKYIKNPESSIGQDVIGKIIEYNPEKNRIIYSQKVVLEQKIKEKKETVLNSLQNQKTATGTVKNIEKFGVFIDLGGIDGFIHISDLSWKRIKNPEDILSVGDTITAKVIDLDKEKGKIKLSLKDMEEEPWTKVFEIYKVGDKIKVKVVKITSFGAFAEIIPGVEGLIHRSQISYDAVERVEDFLTLNEEIEVKIIDMNKSKKRIGLSIIELQKKPIKKIEKDETVYQENENLTLGDLFGDLFNK